ncbi:hypothetical protein HYALB_00005562 [Hymenoscyphus albidus]|uniref:Asparagine-linked glycosylation protein 2 n=1 Tax=Hymenoscyphus albidus TaxID=595503 RepID=A0A9N9Q3W6_9HELO|nr:hypothetical protein HYALB_00005562 [Hymenoscyphus albidus]
MAPKPPTSTKPRTILFFHPDLGIGGAERLIIDAAVGLQNRGHKVVIFTSYCDPKHCFDEARDGTLDVRVRGNTIIPASILSRLTIICAILRQFHLILSTYFTSEMRSLKPDAFVVDQLSAGLPWLRYFYPQTRILFYCHFPDLLLAQGRSSLFKRLYRVPFDTLEQWSMSFADSIVVNSGFTKGVVSRVWPELVKSKDLEIVYPCVDVREKTFEEKEEAVAAWGDRGVILSINRFERKKDIGLAIKAYAGLGKHGREGTRLVLAGGYDHRVQENVLCHKELVTLAESLGLKTATTKTIVTALNVADDVDVLFLQSVPNALKQILLASASLLVYTPSNEHFGIVPLEAMLAGIPVLAANTGGPLETVVHEKTGWLCPPNDVESWTSVMNKAVHKMSKKELEAMGKTGRERVKREFSDMKMAERLDTIITKMEEVKRRSARELSLFVLSIGIVTLDALLNLASWTGALTKTIGGFPPMIPTLLVVVSWISYLAVGTSQARGRPEDAILSRTTTQPCMRAVRKVFLTANAITHSPVSHSILNHRCIRAFTEENTARPTRYQAVVVGGGPAGLAAVANLLDQGKKPILWSDPSFEGGRLNKRYREVPSNTKVKRFVMYAEGAESFKKVIEESEKPNAYTALKDLDQEQTCKIARAGDLCAMLSDGFNESHGVYKHNDDTLRVTLTPTEGWEVELNKAPSALQSEMVVLCTGSMPKVDFLLQFHAQTNIVHLDHGLKPSVLHKKIGGGIKPETVAVIGSSHSAILVLRNLYNIAKESLKPIQIKWLTRHPLRYAVEKDGWILRDNTGLKGEVATWAADHLEEDKLATSDVGKYIEKINTLHSNGGDDLRVYKEQFHKCTKAIFAIGYRKNPLPQIFRGKEEIGVEFDHETGGFKDSKTGDKIEGLYGVGIAFPERVVDPEGNVEHAVGLWKFMSFLKKVVPTWT